MNSLELDTTKAPDFEASAYQDADFGQVKLSDYSGKWAYGQTEI